ncbi:hypothetical protein I4U23_016171 [Adineta vaga]|nr:hypothetical protein I4U23_016171 [Adineta vaga]
MQSTSDETNLDTIWQIWLSNSVDLSHLMADTREQFRSSINYIKTYTNRIECEEFIRSVSSKDRIIFIVDDLLAEQIIFQIHDLQQLCAIYVYTTNRQINQSKFKQFSKFRGFRTHIRQLIASDRRHNDRRERRRTGEEADEQFTFSIFNNELDEDKSTAELDGQFVHSQLLIDCLQRMKSTSKEIEQFASFCRKHKECEKDTRYLKILDEFVSDYSMENSLWWYTRDSFVYRMLNKALRVQHIDMLFLFRFFIRDLAQQLKENQWLLPGSVYRGQSLSKLELQKLQQSVGKLISINSFLSTTLYREVASIYLGDIPDFEKVLFKIDFNPFVDGIKPFADITFYSEFPQEGEILFMLGSVFLIEDVYCDETNTWIVQLNLCSDHDQVLKSIFQFLRKEASRCDFDLLAFGNVLHDMGQFEQANSYYNRCLQLLPSNDQTWKPYCYYLLGLIATENGRNEGALHLFDKSLSIRTKTLKPSDPSIADTINAIARVYFINGKLEQAFELYKKALDIFHKAFGEDDLTSAMTYTNMGVVCRAQEKYSEALDYHLKALDIRKRHLPSDHFRFGTSYNNIGEVYHGLGQYDIALTHYESACNVYKTSLPSRHVAIAILLINKSRIYEQQNDFQEILSCYKKAFTICRCIWPEKNHYLTEIKSIIDKAENTQEMQLLKSSGTLWFKLLLPFKCIASLDPRSAYREGCGC